jgi:hypothetical protein
VGDDRHQLAFASAGGTDPGAWPILGRVSLSRRSSGLLVAAGLWPLLVWPNFVRVVATDERAFDEGGPTSYLVVHVSLAVVSMALGVAVLVVGVRGWRRAREARPPSDSLATRAGRSGRA